LARGKTPVFTTTKSERWLANVRSRFTDQNSRLSSPVFLQAKRDDRLVVVVNDGFAFGAVAVFFLDNGGAIGLAGLFLDHRGAVTIVIAVFRGLTGGYTGTDRSNAHANFIR
jgi:hypothetical protein